MTRIHTAMTQSDRTDRQVSMVLLFVLVVSLTLWSAYIETDGKYVLYTLPVTVFLSHLLFKGPHLVLESRGIAMMFLYAMAATAALALGGSSNAFTSRDLLIILGYLSFFCFQHRSPPIVPAASLLILAAAMAIDVADRPIAISFDLLTSQGLAESSLAFPIGLLVIYFFYERRWLMLFLSSLLFFAAFKRIAILGVAVVIALHVTMRVFGWRSIPRTLAIALVLGCSVFSLFSLQIFEYAANLIADPNVSQNSLSLGRSELAEALWAEIRTQSLKNQLFGFGPGAADAVLVPVAEGANPHNDWLKLYFDYGVLGFVILHVILLLMHGPSGFAQMLYIYTAIVMMTDNVLLYIFHFVFVYMTLTASSERLVASQDPSRALNSQAPPRQRQPHRHPLAPRETL